MKHEIIWSEPDEDDNDSYDLCGKVLVPIRIDIIMNTETELWSVNINHRRILSGFITRVVAKEWIENNFIREMLYESY